MAATTVGGREIDEVDVRSTNPEMKQELVVVDFAIAVCVEVIEQGYHVCLAQAAAVVSQPLATLRPRQRAASVIVVQSEHSETHTPVSKGPSA